MTFAVKKLIRHTNDKKWDTVALYDQNNNFRGEALFESRDDAQKYLELYKRRVNGRLNAYGKTEFYKPQSVCCRREERRR